MRLALLVSLSIVLFFPTTGSSADYKVQIAFPLIGFSYATDIDTPPDGTNRIVVVEKRGRFLMLPNIRNTPANDVSVFLDIQSKVFSSSEAGALGIAFHPDYAQNGFFYVYYVTPAPYHAILARYQVSADPDVADSLSETILIDQPKITPYHNGGQLMFGPDGYLYLSMGEDLQFDPAQDLTNLFGSILRIDVDNPANGLEYGIPPDNPFAGNSQGYREEIWAYGFRNPWRFSIDTVSGDILAGDVGENTWEEIDLVEPGQNYGWPYVEGPDCLDPPQCTALGSSLIAPLYTYNHTEGYATIGGPTYRGTHFPELYGKYLFADYASGMVWALTYDGIGPPQRTVLVDDAPAIHAFGRAPNNEFYFCSPAGYVFEMTPTATAAGDAPAPAESRLVGNYPNPFNPTTTIRYELASAARVTIDVVSVNGARVQTLDAGQQPAGAHDLAWRGDTASGDIAASGVYFYRLRVDGAVVDTRRMVLLK